MQTAIPWRKRRKQWWTTAQLCGQTSHEDWIGTQGTVGKVNTHCQKTWIDRLFWCHQVSSAKSKFLLTPDYPWCFILFISLIKWKDYWLRESRSLEFGFFFFWKKLCFLTVIKNIWQLNVKLLDSECLHLREIVVISRHKNEHPERMRK